MLKEVKDLKIKEIEQKKRECEELLSKLGELQQKRDGLISKRENNTSLIVSKKFNFLQKYITKRKEYKEYTSAIESNDEISSMVKDLDNNIDVLIQELKEKQNIPPFEKIKKDELTEKYNKKIDEIQSAENFYDMGMDAEQAKKLLTENDIEIKYDSCKEALQLSPDEFGTDEEFMKKAIHEDKNLIVCDKTNSDELYTEYLSELKKDMLEAEERDVQGIYSESIEAGMKNIDKIIEEIKTPRSPEYGKYKIPHELLYESIRINAGKECEKDSFREGIFGEKINQLDKGVNISNECLKYLNVDCSISAELGEELAGIWKDPNNTFVIHNILRNHKNYGMSENELEEKAREVIDGIFTKGLRATNAMGELSSGKSPTLAATSVRQGKGLTFIDVIDYDYAGGVYNMIMQVPNDAFVKEDATPIWGTNDKNAVGGDREFYLLPEYVYGCFKAKDSNATMVKNEGRKKEQYKYISFDYDARNECEIIDNEPIQEDREI